MEYTGTDIYCDAILSKKMPIAVVEETINILAFYHGKPHWKTHIVVIPKKHIDSLLSLTKEDNEILLELIEVIKRVSQNVVAGKGAARVLTNLGTYQDSKHLHFHIISGEENKI